MIDENSRLTGNSNKPIVVISDSDYKSTRKSNVNFNTNYLTFREEVKLMNFKNMALFSRSIKTILFIFLSPILCLWFLQQVQNLSDYYNDSNVVKEPKEIEIDSMSLKCSFSPNCISIGISAFGEMNEVESHQLEYLIQSIANQTSLNIGTDIKLITKGNEDINTYLLHNQGIVQYVIAFCFESIEMTKDIRLPCRFELNNPNDNQINFNLYTIIYNVTMAPNGFENFGQPWPSDPKLVRLKTIVDNAYLEYYATSRQMNSIPQIKNISTATFPQPVNRFVKNANVVALFGVFYLFFPPMILFAIILLELVKEKEGKLKSYTNLYGLSIIGYWTSWMIVSLVLSGVVSLQIVLLGRFYFQYEVFTNVNLVVSFLLFFLFCLSMQFVAMYLSSIISSMRTATTVTYSVIIVGIVVQCVISNYGVIYFFYATNIESYKLLIWLVLICLHFYPPFLYSKGYLDISRVCTFHFDSPSLQWMPGRYFSLSDLFHHQVGKLRIGVEYNVDSLFRTFIWFYFLMLLMVFLIAAKELKDYYKYNSYMTLLRELYSSRGLKKINMKKQKIENAINKFYDIFLKNDSGVIYNNADSDSLIVQENHKSVYMEKKYVAQLNKKRTVPSGMRILSISKDYISSDGSVTNALSDVNLELGKGEVFGILGPNGAGKSTLINILTCQISSSHGYAKLGPFMIHSEMFMDSIYVKRLIGICSQFDYFWEELTVFEVLFIYSRLRGIHLNRIDNYIKDKIKQVGLEKKLNETVRNLSGGMRRRLSICISTLGDPMIIFMDEPTTGLDPNNRRKIWKLINNIKKDRVIVLSTHLMDEAEYLSDRLGIIVNGKLRFVGSSTDMRSMHFDGIYLKIVIDLNKIGESIMILDDNIKYVFIRSQINYSNAGIFTIMIKHSNKRDMIKAFEMFKRKSDDTKIREILNYVKDVSISQSNLESVFISVCKKYN